LIWSVKNLGHVVGFTDLKSLKCLLLLGDNWSFLWGECVGHSIERIWLLLYRVGLVGKNNIPVKEPEVGHLLRQMITNQLFTFYDAEDTFLDYI